MTFGEGDAAERWCLRAVADLLEVPPMFEWSPSVESCLKASVIPATATFWRLTESILRTRPIAAPNVGIAEPSARM